MRETGGWMVVDHASEMTLAELLILSRAEDELVPREVNPMGRRELTFSYDDEALFLSLFLLSSPTT